MKVCWVISESVPGDQLHPGELKTIAEAWGSWQTHEAHKTENCICSNTSEASTLTKLGFQTSVNLYISEESYLEIGRPPKVKLFGGKFGSDGISNKDDIVALNLTVSQYDLILLLGFDFSPTTDAGRDEYYFNVKEIIKANADTQFVLVDYAHDMDDWELANLTEDTVESVKSLLG